MPMNVLMAAATRRQIGHAAVAQVGKLVNIANPQEYGLKVHKL